MRLENYLAILLLKSNLNLSKGFEPEETLQKGTYKKSTKIKGTLPKES
jgi:hypothetical protein